MDIHKTIQIEQEADVENASLHALAFCRSAGFGRTGGHFVATAVSELAMNIVKYALPGTIHIRIISRDQKNGIEIIANDSGPGIKNTAQALQDNFSTSGSLGIGLPGVGRMMDEMKIDSVPGTGTKITAVKWLS